MDSLVGRTVGPYRLANVIGRGPTGNIYRGVRLSDERHAAVKVLHGSITVDAGFPERFFAEMRAVSSLRHQNIVAPCDCGMSDGLYFIAMELMRAGSMRALLDRRSPGDPLPLPLAAELICQAAEGLAYAHERGVIHNDIRPSNLLLDGAEEPRDMDESAYMLKITDFGLAHLAASGSAMTFSGLPLGSGIMLGAPAYMSPELCRGQEVDGRGDLYSLGVVLYEMLTGMLPFPVDRLENTIRERLVTPPTLPHLLNPEIPPPLEYVMVRCLAKRADDRFDTAMDLAYAVRAAVPTA